MFAVKNTGNKIFSVRFPIKEKELKLYFIGKILFL